MKFLISTILIALFSFAICLFLPWWSIAIAAFLVAAFIHQQAWKAFVSGFVALLCLWTGLSYWASAQNDHLLAHKISMLLIKSDAPFMLALVTGFIGALIAGFAALSGSLVRRLR